MLRWFRATAIMKTSGRSFLTGLLPLSSSFGFAAINKRGTANPWRWSVMYRHRLDYLNELWETGRMGQPSPGPESPGSDVRRLSKNTDLRISHVGRDARYCSG